MNELRKAAREFLSCRRIAVAGVSRGEPNAGNIIYKRLRDRGYRVFAVNPSATEVEGDPCYHALSEIEGGVDGVVIATRPEIARDVVRECVNTRTPRVWLHRSFGSGSVSQEAIELCASAGIAVIPGACPMMYLDPVDVGHRCIRWVLGATGRLPSMS